MAIVDSHARLFGRINLFDAVLAVLALAMIPFAYGAYVLFRTPPPRLVAIEPQTLIAGPDLRVSIRGEYLRPYMRISFNDVQGNSFIFRNTSEALVDLNPMPPGVYDVVLYDESQERSRLPQAFTIERPPLPASEVLLVGTLGNLTTERAATIKAGMAVTNVGQIVEVSAPMPETTRVFAGPVLEIPIDKAVRLPVVIKAGCAVKAPQGVPQCAIGDAPLQVTALILLHTPIGPVPFQIDQIRGIQRLEDVQITVQFIARRAVVAHIRQGDGDYGQYMNPLAAGAVVESLRPPVQVAEDTDRLDVILTAKAQRGASSWTYASSPLRAGASLLLRTPRYELQGTVLRLSPEWSPPQ